jgi:hypothetical protein
VLAKVIGISLLIVLLLIISYLIWWNLPIEVNRRSDIQLGKILIQNINRFKKENKKLPETGDWKKLEQLGFRVGYTGTEPNYEKVNDSTFELVFLEGFDGPYLLVNSAKNKWEISHPTISNKLKEK